MAYSPAARDERSGFAAQEMAATQPPSAAGEAEQDMKKHVLAEYFDSIDGQKQSFMSERTGDAPLGGGDGGGAVSAPDAAPLTHARVVEEDEENSSSGEDDEGDEGDEDEEKKEQGASVPQEHDPAYDNNDDWLEEWAALQVGRCASVRRPAVGPWLVGCPARMRVCGWRGAAAEAPLDTARHCTYAARAAEADPSVPAVPENR